MKPMFLRVDYELGQIQPEAVWDGVLQKESMWCYAHESSFKSKLADLKDHYGAHVKRAKTLAAHIKENFTEEKIYSKFVSAMETTSAAVPMTQNTQTPPKEDFEEVFVV